MSEQQFHIVALSPLRNSFFDPVSRINLSRTNPQGFIPVGSPISGSIKAGLMSGGLIDVTNSIVPMILKEREEAAKQKKAGFPRPAASAPSADEQSVQPPVEANKEPEAPVIPDDEVPQATPVDAEKPAKPSSRSKTK